MKKKLEINVPDQVNDIRLGQFQQYLKLVEDLGDDATVNEFVKMKMVSIFCDLPLELIRDTFKASLVDNLYTEIKTLLDELIASVTNNKEFRPTFKVGKTTFGFMNDLNGMLAGEYADLTTYFGNWDTMHKAMAVLYRPVIKTKYNMWLKIDQYEIADYKGSSEYGELMKMMPAIKALEATFFLTNSYLTLQKCFLLSMEKQIMATPEISTMLKANSMQIGDGIKAFTALLDKIYSK